MKKVHPLKLLVCCLAIPLIFLSCGGDLEGKVYLDINGNNLKDKPEKLITGVAVTASVNDVDVKQGTTNSSGKYSLDVEGSGTVCVETNLTKSGTTPALKTLTRASTVGSSGLLLQATTDTTDTDTTDTETVCDDGTDDDGDGDTDCDDSDCASDTACTSEESDDDSSTEDSTTATVESGKACNDYDGFGGTLDVPIALDYASGVESLSDPSTKTVSRGGTASLSVIYPQSCTFELIYLSTSVTPSGVPSDSYDSVTGQFNFNRAIAAAFTTTNTSLSIDQDPLKTYTLPLNIVQDGSLETKTVTMTPEVTCPDDSTVTLKKHTIEINSKNDITVTQSLSGTVARGQTLTVTTTVTNGSTLAFASTGVKLTITTPDLTTSQSYSSSCKNLGQSGECKFDLAAGASQSLTTTFVVPSSLSATTSFTSKASLDLTSGGTTTTFTGDSITFSLSAGT